MSNESRFKRFRAVLRNAVVWGVAWGALGTVVASVMRLTDNIPFGNAVLDGIGMGIRIGVVGALAGVAFSTFISLAYRGKSLREINPMRFGIGGALLAGAFVPAWMQTMNLLSGSGLVSLNLITDDIVLSAVFGGITAAGTMLLAKNDAARNPDVEEEPVDQIDSKMLNEADPAESIDEALRQKLRT